MAEAEQAGTRLELPGGDGAGGGLARVSALADNVRGRFVAMPPGRRKWMGASALLVAAAIAGIVWYGGRTDWRVLFSGLDAKDTQQISQELAAAGIPYQMTEDGSGVEVGADQVEKARMEVATKGMPQSGRMGFELFDKPNWVGSEFDEKVNYQRALEGELEHTIGTLAVVRSARVHIVLPKDSLFGASALSAKATVVLQLRRSVMPPEQAEAIRSLVAGAVESLGSENVTLVDADGRLNLTAPNQGSAGGDAERSLAEKLVTVLEPTAGGGNVRATVNVAYDLGSSEKTDDVYDPTQVATLSSRKTEQTTGAKQRVAGVPGTASNSPGAVAPGSVAAGAKPVAGAVPPLLQTATSPPSGTAGAGVQSSSLPVYPQGTAGGVGDTATDETGTYAVTRHQLHSEQGPGQVRRIAAAIVVNDRMSIEGAGKLAHPVWKSRGPEEMQRLEQLARAAVGFNATRGDVLVIENVGFSSNAPEVAPAALERAMDQADSLLHAQPGLLKTLSFSALALLLLMMVVRPMTQQMMKALMQTPPLTLASGASGQAVGVGGRAAGAMVLGPGVGKPALATLLGGARPTDTQAIYDHISEQIRSEPGQSTRLLQSWISAPVEDKD